MTVLVSDSFNRANSTATLGNAGTGQTWLTKGGDWGILNNQAYLVTDDGKVDPKVAYFDVGQSDVSINVTIPVVNDNFACAFRLDTTANTGIIVHTGTIKIQSFSGESYTTIADSGIWATNGDVIKVTIQGTSITVFQNGTQILTGTSAINQTSTKHGLGNYQKSGATGASGMWDNFQIDSIGTGGGTTGSTLFDLKQSIYSTSSLVYNLKQALYQTLSQYFDTKIMRYQSVMTNFDSRQTIYQAGSSPFDSKQVVYQDGSIGFDSKQTIYNASSAQYDTKQTLYNVSATQYDTRQGIYAVASALYDTLQQIADGGIPGSTRFDTRMVLYADNQALFDTKQTYYRASTDNYALKQAIYQAVQLQCDMKLVIYADSSVKTDMLQRIYNDDIIEFDTLQQFIENWSEYREVIRIPLTISSKQAVTLVITQREELTLNITQRQRIDIKL